MTSVLGLCKPYFKANIDASTDQEHLKHEVIDGL
jgi:hypothetical protein